LTIAAAVIGAVGTIVAALVGSSASTQSSVNARITVVAGQGERPPDVSNSSPVSLTSSGPAAVPTAITATSVQSLSDSPNHWIAQLASVPYSDGSSARDQQLEQIQTSIPQAQWLPSDEYGSLTPGFWVLYVNGPFINGAAAFDFCRNHGRSNETICVGRYLSSDPADHGLQCAWTGTESPPAVCYAEPRS